MFEDEDNPIKEYNPIRLSLSNFEDEYESEYTVTDLHDCSTDLSDRGSRKEENAHSEFVERARRNRNSSSYNNTKKTKGFKFYLYIILVILAIYFFSIFALIIEGFFEVFSEIKQESIDSMQEDFFYEEPNDFYDTNYDDITFTY